MAAYVPDSAREALCTEDLRLTLQMARDPMGMWEASAPLGSQVYLPAQTAQSSAQAAGPANGLSQAGYQQASDSSGGSGSASQYASSQGVAPLAYSDATQATASQQAAPVTYSQAASSQAAAPVASHGNSQAASSQAAAPLAYFGNSQAVASQATTPVAYSSASDAAAPSTDATTAAPATSVPNSKLNPGQHMLPSCGDV